jgi:hypothetical protein
VIPGISIPHLLLVCFGLVIFWVCEGYHGLCFLLYEKCAVIMFGSSDTSVFVWRNYFQQFCNRGYTLDELCARKPTKMSQTWYGKTNVYILSEYYLSGTLLQPSKLLRVNAFRRKIIGWAMLRLWQVKVGFGTHNSTVTRCVVCNCWISLDSQVFAFMFDIFYKSQWQNQCGG